MNELRERGTRLSSKTVKAFGFLVSVRNIRFCSRFVLGLCCGI